MRFIKEDQLIHNTFVFQTVKKGFKTQKRKYGYVVFVTNTCCKTQMRFVKGRSGQCIVYLFFTPQIWVSKHKEEIWIRTFNQKYML